MPRREWPNRSLALLAIATVLLTSCGGVKVSEPVVVCPPLIAWPSGQQQALGEALAAERDAAEAEHRAAAAWHDPVITAVQVLVDQRRVIRACRGDPQNLQ